MQPEATDQYHRQVTSAIRAVRDQVRWKPGKGAQHLRTRQDYGHLPVTATLDDYQAIIASIRATPPPRFMSMSGELRLSFQLLWPFTPIGFGL